jgi:hypothetical protein
MNNGSERLKLEKGQKVWLFDRERRVYSLPDGTKTSSPWFRGHFIEKYVVGETKVSYILGNSPATNPDDKRLTDRLKKSEIKEGKNVYISEKSIDEACWVHDNWSQMSHKFSNCEDYGKRTRILEILNEE